MSSLAGWHYCLESGVGKIVLGSKVVQGLGGHCSATQVGQPRGYAPRIFVSVHLAFVLLKSSAEC